MWVLNIFNKKVFRFLIVGIINTIVGTGLMFILYNVFNVSYWISSACNYIVGGILSFFLNKYFTFKNYQKSMLQVILFILNLVVCYFIAYMVAKQLVYFCLSSQTENIKGNISLALGMCIYTGLNYIGQRFHVFTDKKRKR